MGGVNSTPIGVIYAYIGAIAPQNYLICDGSEFDITEYSKLYNLIGSNKLPDLRGKTIVGLNSTDTDFSTLFKIGGEKKHTLTLNEMPSHTHAQNAHYHHTRFSSNEHLSSGRLKWYGNPGDNNANNNIGNAAYYDTADATATNKNTGGGQAHNNLQPYLVLNYIIRAK